MAVHFLGIALARSVTLASSTGKETTTTVSTLPSAIMPSDVSASMSGATTPTTLLIDTQTPPSASSGMSGGTMTEAGDGSGRPASQSTLSSSDAAPSSRSSLGVASSTGAPVNIADSGTSTFWKQTPMGCLGVLCIVAGIAAGIVAVQI